MAALRFHIRVSIVVSFGSAHSTGTPDLRHPRKPTAEAVEKSARSQDVELRYSITGPLDLTARDRGARSDDASEIARARRIAWAARAASSFWASVRGSSPSAVRVSMRYRSR